MPAVACLPSWLIDNLPKDYMRHRADSCDAACNVEKFTVDHPKMYSDKGKYEMLFKLAKSNLADLVSINAQEKLSGL